MPILADQVDGVIGVDTHKEAHTAAACGPTGGVAAQIEASTCQAGLAELLAFGRAQVPGPRAWAVEGCGSYGAGLATYLLTEGETVVEVERPTRPKRRHGAKSDDIDAARAAREALGTDVAKLALPKQGAAQEALRVVMAARGSVIEARKAATNLLTHLRITAPAELRDQLPARTGRALLEACAALPDHLGAGADQATATVAATLARVAGRIQTLAAEEARYDRELTELTASLVPAIVTEPGAGPVTAAQMILAYGHHGRVRTEAAYGSLSGTCPIPASSGKTTRHRLNRGGNRQLNRALHTIATNRMRYHPETRAYTQRRRAEGKTDREIRRCLKRYLARHFYRQLAASPTLTA